MLDRSLQLTMMCCFAAGLQAQEVQENPFSKGRFFVSAAASWKTEDYDLKDIKRWNLEPMVGYFFMDKLSAGLGGVIGLNSFDYLKTSGSDAPATYKYSERGWGALGPFIRGHAGGPRVSIFGQIGGYFGSINETSENNYSSPTVVTYEVRKGPFQLYDLGAGIAWYYKGTVGIEAIAHYYLAYAQTDRDVHTSTGEVTDYPRERNSADGGGGSIGVVFLFGLAKGQKTSAPAN